MERKLTTILAADVVGYSTLMENDEAGTFDRLRAHRKELFEPEIVKHHGRIFKLMGDGLLAEFGSVVDAVECAVALQRGLAERNAYVPEEQRIDVRIGINLGEVIIEGDDRFGEGVNIAARLQELADPGAIFVSGKVAREVERKLAFGFEPMGERRMKNISEPLACYRVMLQVDASTKAGTLSFGPPTASDRVTIAVLPFVNMGGDPVQEYFSDGITEDIITELSRFRELRVSARNSSFLFRGKTVDVKDVAQKLGVQFVVEGSVRKIGNRVRVTVQLIDTTTAAHVWAERYDRDLTDIFVIQDEITRMVVTRVSGHAKSAIVHRNRSRPTKNPSAYDCYLRARELYGDSASLRQSEFFLLKAIDLDPNFAAAHALLSIRGMGQFLNEGQRKHLDNALTIGRKAFALDSEEPWASFAVGAALMYLRRLDEAAYYFDRAIALNSNEMQFLAIHALWMNFMGRTEAALLEIEEALRLDPYAYHWFWGIRGSIQTIAGRYRDAIESFQRMKSPWRRCYLAICHVELGQIAEAQACLEEFRMAMPGMTPEDVISNEPYVDAATSKRLVDTLRRANLAAQR